MNTSAYRANRLHNLTSSSSIDVLLALNRSNDDRFCPQLRWPFERMCVFMRAAPSMKQNNDRLMTERAAAVVGKWKNRKRAHHQKKYSLNKHHTRGNICKGVNVRMILHLYLRLRATAHTKPPLSFTHPTKTSGFYLIMIRTRCEILLLLVRARFFSKPLVSSPLSKYNNFLSHLRLLFLNILFVIKIN